MNRSFSPNVRRLNIKPRKADSHHILTVAVTLLHVAVAIATIAIIVRGQRII
jgi:hypothetical protein